jgi:hypothetical protein
MRGFSTSAVCAAICFRRFGSVRPGRAAWSSPRPGLDGGAGFIRAQGHVRILEKLARPDALQAAEVLHQIIAGLATMFMPQGVNEGKRIDELFGPDQKTAAINFPFIHDFIHERPPLGTEIDRPAMIFF